MGRCVDVHESVFEVEVSGNCETGLPGTDVRYLPDDLLDTLPLIEISDKDYRSFCLPCHALEEPDDC